MEVWKITFHSKWVICRFHVSLPGCTTIHTRDYRQVHPYRDGRNPPAPVEVGSFPPYFTGFFLTSQVRISSMGVLNTEMLYLVSRDWKKPGLTYVCVSYKTVGSLRRHMIDLVR